MKSLKCYCVSYSYTKFFLNLEKKRATINTIYQIKKDQGEICKHPTKILSEIQKHFKDIYKKDEAITNVEEQMNDFMQDIQHEVLDEENKEFCDSEITTKEMSEARNVSTTNQHQVQTD